MRNLSKIWHSIPPDKRAVNWYREVNIFLRGVASQTGLSLPQVAAIFSALSPATNFENNKKDCYNVCSRVEGYRCGTYGPNVEKAVQIRDGLIPPDQAFSLKTGPKTFNFYYNVLSPEDPGYVTIDRHAYRIATGEEYTTIRGGKYEEVAQHYKRTARGLGCLPSELQAALWVEYRIREGIRYKEFKLNQTI